MNRTFEPMSAAERARFQASYLSYLKDRDGLPDMKAQRFDVRERFFAQIDREPVRWQGTPPVDQAVFERNHAQKGPGAGLDEATLWALATAKTNRAERYGVEYSITYKGHESDAATNPHAYIQIEECYHTRILKDALATIGVRMDVSDPGLPVKAMVRAMVRLPDAYANVAILCGEIFGVVVFSLLLEKARELFTQQPAALSRIEELLAQILVDEVGHVHFVRSTLGPRRLAWARRLMPVVALASLAEMPELVQLFGRREILRRVKEADVDAAAAAFPDRFDYLAA